MFHAMKYVIATVLASACLVASAPLASAQDFAPAESKPDSNAESNAEGAETNEDAAEMSKDAES